MMLKKSQVKFVIYFVIIFLVLFSLLYSVGLIPESLKNNEGDTVSTLWDKAQKKTVQNDSRRGSSVVIKAEEPKRIVIDKIGVDAAVSNPSTTNVATLDEYLKQGAVRYPSSGLLGQGNMFIFGHSTGLTVVNNQAYKTFNGIKNLQNGDLIKVYGSNTVYVYKVRTVTLVDQNEALVKFDTTTNRLTLSTCNTFGAKGERYVVEADYLQ
jgi:LPXTG-site transpeptidase (sortase) family protein